MIRPKYGRKEEPPILTSDNPNVTRARHLRVSFSMKRSAFVALALGVAACQDSAAPAGAHPLGPRFKIVGEAAGGGTPGCTAFCPLHLVIEIRDETRTAAGWGGALANFGGWG